MLFLFLVLFKNYSGYYDVVALSEGKYTIYLCKTSDFD
jgi:hypothetical protein